MSRTIKYNAQFNNAIATARIEGANYYFVLPQTGQGTVYAADKGDYATCTGYYTGQNSGDPDTQKYWLLQTTNGLWLLCDTESESSSAWVLSERTTKLSDKSQSAAQKYIDTIIANNKTILGNNLLCARFSSKLSTAQKRKLYDLQTRLQERNEALQNDSLTTGLEEGTPAGYKELEGYLDSFMSAGVGSAVVSIIITAIVIASVSTAAYYAYKYYAEQSEADVKYSDELTKILTSKLTDEEYQQLMNETKGLVTKATIKAKFGSSITKYIGIAALVIGGVLLFKNLLN